MFPFKWILMIALCEMYCQSHPESCPGQGKWITQLHPSQCKSNFRADQPKCLQVTLMPENEFPDMQIFCLLSSPNPLLVTKWSLCASSDTRKASVLSLSFGQGVWLAEVSLKTVHEGTDTAEGALKCSPSRDWGITEIILKYGLHEN